MKDTRILDLCKRLAKQRTALLITRLRKVHSFISASYRLMDLRGRNALLVLLRKLLALTLASIAQEIGCKPLILRCGGNAIYVAVEYENDEQLRLLHEALKAIGVVYAHLLEPIEVAVELARVARRDGKTVLDLVSEVCTPREIEEVVEVNGVDKRVVVSCDVCGLRGFGVSREAHGYPFVLHVLREEHSLCSKDFMVRLLGRTLNSPGVVTVFILDRFESKSVEETSKIVFMYRHNGLAVLNVTLETWFTRHPVAGRPGEELITGVLDDVMTLTLNVSFTYRGSVRSTSVTALVIGVKREAIKPLRNVRDEIRSEAKGIQPENPAAIDRLMALFKDYRGRVEAAAVKSIDKVLDTLNRVAKPSPRFEPLIKTLSKILDEIRGATGVMRVVPPLHTESIPRVMIDAETTLINLDGRETVLDLTQVMLGSDSNFIAFLRSDGDRFGTLTSLEKLVEEFEKLGNPELSQEVGRVVDEAFRATGHTLSEVKEAVRQGLLKPTELIQSYVWDSVIEHWLQEILKQALILHGLLENPLIIYIGGDENLLVIPLIGRTSDMRLESLVRNITTLRQLLLLTSSNAVKDLSHSLKLSDIYEALAKLKISTLTSAVILAHHKYPAYMLVLLADELVELAKEVSRDATIFFTVATTTMIFPSKEILGCGMMTPLPNELALDERRVVLSNVIVQAYRVTVEATELRDIQKAVLDYVMRSRENYQTYMRLCNDILRAVVKTQPAFRPLNTLAMFASYVLIPNPYLTVYEVLRLLERGL